MRSLRSIRKMGPIVFVLFLLLFCVDVCFGFWDHDSGFYLMQSLMIAKGIRPYLDYQPLYPPFFFLIQAIPISLGLPKVWIALLSPIFWASLIAIFSYLWIQCLADREDIFRDWGRFASWALGGCYFIFCIDFGGNHVTLEHGVVFLGMLALLIEERVFLKDLHPVAKQALIGFLVGASVLVKQVGILLILPFFFRAKFRSKIPYFFLGFFLPFFIFLAWLDFQFLKILESIELLGRYLKSDDIDNVSVIFHRLYFVLRDEFFRTPSGFFFITFFTNLACFSIWNSFRDGRRKNAIWLSSWITVWFFYVLARAKNNFPHYTINCWVAICAMAPEVFKTLGLINKRIRISLICGMVLLVASAHFVIDAKTIDRKPYFSRWSYGSRLLDFLIPVSRQLQEVIPEDATVTILGFEEEILLFLADRVPLNKDWSQYDMQASLVGDFLLINHFSGSWAWSKRDDIRANGYIHIKNWSHVDGDVDLFRK